MILNRTTQPTGPIHSLRLQSSVINPEQSSSCPNCWYLDAKVRYNSNALAPLRTHVAWLTVAPLYYIIFTSSARARLVSRTVSEPQRQYRHTVKSSSRIRENSSRSIKVSNIHQAPTLRIDGAYNDVKTSFSTSARSAGSWRMVRRSPIRRGKVGRTSPWS
jgi:hypothetical protein